MRKYTFAFFTFLLVLVGLIYVFIPSKLAVSKIAFTASNGKTIHRALTDSFLLKEVASANRVVVNGNKISFDKLSFQFKEQLTDNISVPIFYGAQAFESYLSIVNIKADSSAIEWRTQIHTGNDPFTKVQRYFRAGEVQEHMSKVLNMLQNFASKPENIYHIGIRREKVTDTLLISIKTITPSYPTTDQYYGLVNELQAYAASAGVNAVNFPMLHIEAIDSNRYETMVALPINKGLPNKGNIIFKKMVPGNILTAEVKGGTKTIEEGFLQLGNYITDYNLVSPAISFQSLVTNRQGERDTSKWITKLYSPIF